MPGVYYRQLMVPKPTGAGGALRQHRPRVRTDGCPSFRHPNGPHLQSHAQQRCQTGALK